MKWKWREVLKYSPLSHQKKAIRKGLGRDALALFMEPGTGKTYIAIGVAGIRVDVQKVLIVCPSVVQGEWLDELEKHAAYDYHFKGEKGKGKEIWLITYRQMWGNLPDILKWQPDLAVLDEAHALKNRTTKQSKASKVLGNKVPYRMMLTGTPVTEGVEDLWGMYRFLDRSVFPDKYKTFESQYVRKGGWMGKQVVGYKNMRKLKRQINPSAFFMKLCDAIELPRKRQIKLLVNLERSAMVTYRQMAQEFTATVQGSHGKENILAPNVLAKLVRLQQITGGFLGGLENGRLEHVSNAKLKGLKEFLDTFPKSRKLIIYVKFLWEIDRICEVLSGMKISHGVIKGKRGKKGKVEIRKLKNAFQKEKDPQVLVIQVKSGIGLTLTAAREALFYSMDYSYEKYYQNLHRNLRIGSHQDLTYYYLIAEGTVDEDIYRAIKRKRKVADLLWDIYENSLRL